ncbi:MAG: tRNA (N6-threonylcarbamoyladenosine(37)-N6)-methyltransferase TrmO [Firmicutes bacterium]|nr:tRNA (N6-threonylcarbamoyladenosine(37)-N6)-methyltransferase TrmO [Bacillota bacterium]
MNIEPIAHLHNDFPEKFGLPRQSGLAENLISKIVMEKPYQVMDAFRGITGYSHLWLLWEFDPLTDQTGFHPTVRPPKLGGNERVGVFATRSPNRPNRLGLTLVRLIRLEESETNGPVLVVAGADMRSGTAIYDIKPYIPYADQAPDAAGGFTERIHVDPLAVVYECAVPGDLTKSDLTTLNEVLSLDPRPGYQNDSHRIYGMSYRNYQIRFRIENETIYVMVIE